MSNFLTKEEIRLWRSSLEKITLEEYAARLGKTVEESKPTNDVIDIVKSQGTSSNTDKNISDGFSAIAERAFARERQISHTPFSIRKITDQNTKIVEIQQDKTSVNNNVKNIIKSTIEKQESTKRDNIIKKNIKEDQSFNIVLKKALTDREQMVFDYFLNNVGKTVFAKDLAELLNLPRDYVYKYIKNLRTKIEGDKLQNVPTGGFVLTK